MKKAFCDLEKLERLKIGFQFLFVLVFSSTVGIILARSVSDNFYANWVFRISTHFETVFINCTSLFDYVLAVCRYSLFDLVSVIIVFAVSFSVLNYILTDIVLLYSGVKFGVSVAFLVEFLKRSSSVYSVGRVRLFIFILFEFAFLALLFAYSYATARSSARLREVSSVGRPNLNATEVLKFSAKALAYVGAVLILNFLYCFLLYVSK